MRLCFFKNNLFNLAQSYLKSVLNMRKRYKKRPKSLVIPILLFVAVTFYNYIEKEIESDKFNTQYKVLKVLDGDTIQVTDGNLKLKVRMIGIDAPERAQKYGDFSKKRLKDKILNQFVSLKVAKKTTDSYGRILAEVFYQTRNINIEMVQESLAFYYRPFCQSYPNAKEKYDYDILPYVMAEEQAKKQRKYIWSDQKEELPCEFRRLKKRKKKT